MVNDGEKFRGGSFEHFLNFHGMLKKWNGGPLFHKFAYICQMAVELQGILSNAFNRGLYCV